MYQCTRILWASLFVFAGLDFKVSAAGFPRAWGTSAFGLTNPPSQLTNVIAFDAGPYHNLVVLENRTVVGWGDNTFGKANGAGLTGVIGVAGGANHSLALRQNGRVVAWGDGSATNVPAGITDAMSVAAGEFHSLALRSNGVAVAWGANNHGQGTSQAGPFVAIAAGANHNLALRPNGTVAAWGQNSFLQCNVPLNLSGVIAIAAGDRFSMALLNNGTIATWGSIASPPPHSGIVAIAAGGSHGMALRNDRTVLCWGDNSLNQCVIPSGTINVIGISGGATHSLALRMAPPAIVAHPIPRTVLRGNDTTFSATFTGNTPIFLQWRQNGIVIPGATNNTYTVDNAQPGDAGNYSLLVSNRVGTAISTNALLTVNVPAFITDDPDSTEVTEGTSVTLSVTADGTPTLRYRWQKNGTNINAATNRTLNFAIVTNTHAGNYRCIVTNAFGSATSLVATLTVLPKLAITTEPQSQSVLAGSSVTFSGAANIALGYQWMKNGAEVAGATDASLTISPVQTSDAGSYRLVATNLHSAVTSAVAVLTVEVLPSGESMVVQWGENPVFNGVDQVDITVPDGLVDVAAIAAGAHHDLVLLRNGRVFGWGDNLFGHASSPATLTNARAISAGMHHSVAIASNGTVVAWGRNDLNQTNVPPGLSGIVAIAAGANHTLALRSNGTVASWGHTNFGQTAVPSNATNIMAIAAGFEHSLALTSNGVLRTWGNNDFGQRLPPFPLSNLIAVAAGKYHSLALRNDGRVFAWGQNTFQQTNLPPGLSSGIMAIAAGDNHSIALHSNRTVICWGQNNFLQTLPPDDLGPVQSIAAGGNRSLVAVMSRLRLHPPVRLASGNIRLRIVDPRRPIYPSRASKVEVYASSDPALPLAQRTRRNITFTLVNGALEGEDVSPLPELRFYIALER